jgi:hypothetical protein
MKSTLTCSLLAVWLTLSGLAQTHAAEPQFAHMVYFDLKEATPDAKEKLVAGCKEYLSEHEGTIFFAAGVIAEDMDRDVNVRDFDVSLHLVFENKAAHDVYHSHPRHLKFIEEYSDLWENVRVFDSYLASGKRPAKRERAGQTEKVMQRIPLPDLAASFAGMIKGEVVEKREGQVVILVAEVTREWRASKAKQPQVMVGKRVLVIPGESDMQRRFVSGLQVGDSVEIDVAHKRGEALTILELTAAQRERVSR